MNPIPHSSPQNIVLGEWKQIESKLNFITQIYCCFSSTWELFRLIYCIYIYFSNANHATWHAASLINPLNGWFDKYPLIINDKLMISIKKHPNQLLLATKKIISTEIEFFLSNVISVGGFIFLAYFHIFNKRLRLEHTVWSAHYFDCTFFRKQWRLSIIMSHICNTSF